MTKAILSSVVAIALFGFPGAASAQRGGSTSYTEDRINQLQQTITELGRRIQELQRQNQQLQQQVEKMRASYEQRLERLEKGAAAKAPARRTGQAKP